MDQLVIFAFETIIDDKNKKSEEKIQILNLCLEFGVNINHGDSMLLFSAINNNDFEMVYFLKDNGINLRARNDSALINVCDIGNISFNMLEENSENKLKIIKLLVSEGLDVNIRDGKIIVELCKYNTKFAIITDIVKILVEYGMNVLTHDNLLFIKACEYNDISLATYLISIGATFTNIILNNNTHMDVYKLLLENGYNPNTIHDGSCLLEKSINDIAKCKLLFEYGSDINYCYNIINCKYDFLKKISFRPSTKTQLVDLFMSHGLDITNIVLNKIEK